MKTKFNNSQWLDYFVPCLLIALALAVSYVATSSSSYISNNILSKFLMNFSSENKTAVFYKNLAPGLYKDRQGKVKFITYNGTTININDKYHKEIKNSLAESLLASPGIDNIRTTELYDYIQESNATSFYTFQYSKIILALSKEINNKTDEKLLQKLGNTADKISKIELKLAQSRAKLLQSQLEYELTKTKYREHSNKWSKNWQNYLNCKKNSDSKCIEQYLEITTAFSKLYNVYLDHVKATNEYKSESKKLKRSSIASMTKLKLYYGRKFDILLTSLNNSKTVPDEIKEVVMPLAEEIKLMKDPIAIKIIRIKELTSRIDITQPVIAEKVSYFNTININFEKNKTLNMQCIASCMIHSGSNCYNICNYTKK